MKKILFLFIILLSTPVLADIKNPQLIDNMRAEITETGTIEVSGSVSNVQLNVSIPQEDSYQKIESFEVSDNNGACTNLCSYSFVYDDYGNKMLSINWENVNSDLNFKIKSTVNISRRYLAEKKFIQDFLKPTSLVQSTDTEIAGIASKARGSDFEKVAYLSKWINENIRYNTVYSEINIPAKQILDLRVGVCKEFSNLLVSFMRNLGYYSAVTVGYVHPGQIYGGDTFLPHGWTEVYNDEGILSDPTWAEVGFLDATHIKFATLPDSSWTFTSLYSTGFGNFKVDMKGSNVSVKLLGYEEKPVVSFNSTFLEDGLWKGYAVLRTDLTANICLLTKFDIRSCNSRDGDFLEKITSDNITYFCNKKSLFTIFRIPELQKGMSYTCPVSVLTYGGGQKNIPLTLSYGNQGYTQLTVDKSVASPNEKVTASAPDSDIFTDNGDYGYVETQFPSPYYDFNVYSYNKGALDQKSITVILNKPLEASLQANDTAYAGKWILVNVSVRNLLQNPQEVSIKFKNQTQKEYVSGLSNFSFNFTPQSKSDELIQVVISTSDFSTSLSKPITVIEQKSAIDVASGFFDSVLKAVSNFFKWLLSLFK